MSMQSAAERLMREMVRAGVTREGRWEYACAGVHRYQCPFTGPGQRHIIVVSVMGPPDDSGVHRPARTDEYQFYSNTNERSAAMVRGLATICQNYGWDIVFMNNSADVPAAIVRRWVDCE